MTGLVVVWPCAETEDFLAARAETGIEPAIGPISNDGDAPDPILAATRIFPSFLATTFVA